MNIEDKERAQHIALGMYADEPCRICRELITVEDLATAVFVGYAIDSRSRSAHGPCWKNKPPQKDWAIPL